MRKEIKGNKRTPTGYLSEFIAMMLTGPSLRLKVNILVLPSYILSRSRHKCTDDSFEDDNNSLFEWREIFLVLFDVSL